MTETLSITLPDLDDLRQKPVPVYHRYRGQTRAQPAFIEMDEDGAVGVDWDGIIGGGIPFKVRQGRTLRWSIPNTLTGAALADFLGREDVQALLERINLGHFIELSCGDYVLRLTHDAVYAQLAFERLCETAWDDSDHAHVWTCEHFLPDLRPVDAEGNVTGWRDGDAAGIRLNSYATLPANATDEKIAKIAEYLESDAKADGIILEDSMADFLKRALNEFAGRTTKTVDKG